LWFVFCGTSCCKNRNEHDSNQQQRKSFCVLHSLIPFLFFIYVFLILHIFRRNPYITIIESMIKNMGPEPY
jgi:hypothetical protein